MSGFPIRHALSQPNLNAPASINYRGTFSKAFLPGGLLKSVHTDVFLPIGVPPTVFRSKHQESTSPSPQAETSTASSSPAPPLVTTLTSPVSTVEQSEPTCLQNISSHREPDAAASAPSSAPTLSNTPTSQKEGDPKRHCRSSKKKQLKQLVRNDIKQKAHIPVPQAPVNRSFATIAAAATASNSTTKSTDLPRESPVSNRTRNKLQVKESIAQLRQQFTSPRNTNSPTKDENEWPSLPNSIHKGNSLSNNTTPSQQLNLCQNETSALTTIQQVNDCTPSGSSNASPQNSMRSPSNQSSASNLNISDLKESHVVEATFTSPSANDHTPTPDRELAATLIPTATKVQEATNTGITLPDRDSTTSSSSSEDENSVPNFYNGTDPQMFISQGSSVLSPSPSSPPHPTSSARVQSQQDFPSPVIAGHESPTPISSSTSPTLYIDLSDVELSPNATIRPSQASEAENESSQARPTEDTESQAARDPLNSRGLSFPGLTTRIDETVHFVLPLTSVMECTETNCDAKFHTDTWTSAKRSLLRHLHVIHKIPKPSVERWCAFCQETISTTKVSSHRCFSNSRYYQVELTGNRIQCNECSYSCETSSAIMNHKRKHVRERVEAQRNSTNQTNGVHNISASSINSLTSTLTGHSQSSHVDSDREISQAPAGSSQVSANDPVVDLPEVTNNENDYHESEETQLDHPDRPSPSSEFISKFKDILSQHDIISHWDHFEELLENYIVFAQDFVNLPPPRSNSSSYRQPNPHDPRFIQKLYKRNRRRAVRLITSPDNSSKCDINHQELADHFCPDAPSFENEELYSHTNENIDPPSASNFTPEEVWARLCRCENSAPGSDRLTYQHWKGVDPEARALASIFSICLKSGRLPISWKITKTIFIPKCDQPTSLTDWRPIAISNTISKLFTGCVAKRLSNWTETNSLLSPCQKGFVPYDGAFENTYVLNKHIQGARADKTPLCIFSLDLSNAFGSIPHAAMFTALRKARIGDAFLKIITDLYEDSKTCFLTDSGTSDPTPIKCGVRQGCPLSGLLFNFVIDPVIRMLQGDSQDFRVLAFADDLLLMARSPQELQTSITEAHHMLSLLGLKINIKKCYSMHLAHSPTKCLDTKFFVDGEPAPVLLDTECKDFLGKPIGYNVFPNPSDLHSISETGVKIMASYLAPWQRLDAMKAFFYPSLLYAQRTAQFPKGNWKEIDYLLRPLYKKTLNLPQRASNHYIYGHREEGLIGMPLCGDDADVAHVDSAFKLLTSPDLRTRDLAWSDLIKMVEARTKEPATPDLLSAYLCGADLPGTTPISCVWSQARSASTRLGVKWSIHEDKSASLCIGNNPITDRKKVFSSIRTFLRKNMSSELRKQKHQGKTSFCFSKAKASTHFFRTGEYFRFADWRFIHKARLGLMELNAYAHDGKPPSCRRCGYQKETLPHVLCHCRPYMKSITNRHNKIVNRIKNSAIGRWRLHAENRTVAGLTVRPDLVFTRGDEAIVLDVTCPFENGEKAFDIARAEKIRKYTELAKELKKRFKKVAVEAIVVGALGSWDPRNDKVLLRLCSKKYLGLMRKLIISDTIRHSRDLYFDFIAGTNYSTATNDNQRTHSNNEVSESNQPTTSRDPPPINETHSQEESAIRSDSQQLEHSISPSANNNPSGQSSRNNRPPRRRRTGRNSSDDNSSNHGSQGNARSQNRPNKQKNQQNRNVQSQQANSIPTRTIVNQQVRNVQSQQVTSFPTRTIVNSSYNKFPPRTLNDLQMHQSSDTQGQRQVVFSQGSQASLPVSQE